MKGFKDFLMRGNLVEIATGLIMATAFAAVVTNFTNFLLEVVGRITGGKEFNFDDMEILGFQTIGPLLTALVAFLIMAAVVYFGVIKPYTAMRQRFVAAEEETTDESVELLREIRDSLRAGRA
ncbi:MscL family protein [Janibacter hoylei]|uniref:Mechanosensitive channel n=2 Tax=Janibacter TaxID=53457 RepID=K1DY09_9MICO|nr:MscL family protein [Janibacter hoylei]EKA61460.1 mechanosensitive channel [Janibacter hoylei PVAS-1]MCT1619461.1 MscL family protein [Janibacter hoylei]MCW4602162.1 MscL family protein [Janibacter hoylei]RWU82610.1 large conductance mechanosensitive channel protein MscL [Janibacter hoylei PVAS-1]